MIRHISIFTLENKKDKEALIKLLKEVAEQSSLIVYSQVGEHIGEKPPVGLEGPHFGDVIQLIDFNNKEDAAQYPQSKEHLYLFEKGPVMKEVTAIDYEFVK